MYFVQHFWLYRHISGENCPKFCTYYNIGTPMQSISLVLLYKVQHSLSRIRSPSCPHQGSTANANSRHPEAIGCPSLLGASIMGVGRDMSLFPSRLRLVAASLALVPFRNLGSRRRDMCLRCDQPAFSLGPIYASSLRSSSRRPVRPRLTPPRFGQ